MNDMDRIHKSLDRLHDKVDSNTATLINNTADLKHHIMRTDLLQEEVAHTDRKVDQIEKSVTACVLPLKMIKSVVLWGGSVTALIYTILKLVELL